VRAAGAHADLTWASDRVRVEIAGDGTVAGDEPAGDEPAGDGAAEVEAAAPATEPENPRHVDTMTAC